MKLTNERDITIEYDDTTESFFIIWEPIVIGLGNTKRSALKDLQKAAHFYIDTTIDIKRKSLNKEKE
jgi:predicted RNase H-like HicB family nuclease